MHKFQERSIVGTDPFKTEFHSLSDIVQKVADQAPRLVCPGQHTVKSQGASFTWNIFGLHNIREWRVVIYLDGLTALPMH